MPYPYYTEPAHDTGTVAPVSGNKARSTAVSKAEGRLKLDVTDKIFLLEPNRHPLVTLLTQVEASNGAYKGSKIMKAPTGNPEFSWFEDVYGGRHALVAANVASTSTTALTVKGAGTNSAYIFTPGDLVKNGTTGEVYLVSAVTAGNALTIVRGYGSTAAANIGVDEDLYIIGNVNEENAGARNVNTTRASKESNFTQIFRTTLAVSGTEDAAKLYGGRDLPYLRSKKATEHALDIERAFWFGEKKEDTGTQGHPRRATGGVLEFLTTGGGYTLDHSSTNSGVITANTMNRFLREGFSYGNSKKTLFAGGIVLQALNEIARGQIRTSVGDTRYGIKVSNWITPFGEVDIVHHPLFNYGYAGSAALLDLESFRYRYMEGRDTTLRTNIQGPDVDGIVDEYLTEAGLERKEAPRHAYLYGAKDAAN